MVLAVGCVHPQGENDDYEGLYFKQNELQTLAKKLPGKPLCIEHLEEQSVGKVLHAWVGETTKKPECFVLFETDDKNLPGHVAEGLITKRFCNDLSLGHTCKIDASSMEVISKEPVEVSICTQGARERTHIYGFGDSYGSSKRTKRTNDDTNGYIMIRALASNTSHQIVEDSQNQTMSESVSETTNNTNAPAPVSSSSTTPETSIDSSSSSSDNMLNEMANQIKQLREQNALLQQQTQMQDNLGKRKREAAVDGSIKEMVQKLFAEYESLGLHKDELSEQLEAMKQSPQANAIVEMLSCAAAAQKSSVVELEKAYQEKKKLVEENKRLKTLTGAFADPTERVVETHHATASRSRTSGSSSTASSNKYEALFNGNTSNSVGQGRGMQQLFPNMWDSMLNSAGPSTTGMQKFGRNDAQFFNSKMSKARVDGQGFESHSFIK
jgi:hypothetical protein